MITIKAHFGEDIRRFSIEEDITFQKLESLLKEIFELENIDIKVRGLYFLLFLYL